jgi:hypothetical protein
MLIGVPIGLDSTDLREGYKGYRINTFILIMRPFDPSQQSEQFSLHSFTMAFLKEAFGSSYGNDKPKFFW